MNRRRLLKLVGAPALLALGGAAYAKVRASQNPYYEGPVTDHFDGVRFSNPPGGPGIRVDSHVYQGYTVPPNYDSMVGKVIAYGASREQAMSRMRIALSEMVVEGILTNIPLHRELLNDTRFMRGGVSIHYLEQKLAGENKKK